MLAANGLQTGVWNREVCSGLLTKHLPAHLPMVMSDFILPHREVSVRCIGTRQKTTSLCESPLWRAVDGGIVRW